MLDHIIFNITQLMQFKDYVVVAIDGQAASGKTTLARQLANHFNAPVIHIDDYFLQSHQRNEERLLEIGGNFDYERFKEEVIKHLSNKKLIIHPFNCQTMIFEEPKNIAFEKLLIIEGVYSMRKEFHPFYDLKIVVTIDSLIQKQRIYSRNPKVFKRFIEEWIPKENMYLTHNDIISLADIHLHIDK